MKNVQFDRLYRSVERITEKSLKYITYTYQYNSTVLCVISVSHIKYGLEAYKKTISYD